MIYKIKKIVAILKEIYALKKVNITFSKYNRLLS